MNTYNYISSKGFMKECDKEENVEVTVAAITAVQKEDCEMPCPLS